MESAAMSSGSYDPGDLKAVQRSLLETARSDFQAGCCVIFALNPITGEFRHKPMMNRGLEKKMDFDQPRPKGIASEVLSNGLVLVSDLDAQPQYQNKFTEAYGIRAFAGLALGTRRIGQKPFAVLYINFRQPRQFDEEEKKRLEIFSDNASALLRTTWLLNRYQEVIRIGEQINKSLKEEGELFVQLDECVKAIIDTSYFFMLGVYHWHCESLDMFFNHEGQHSRRPNQPLSGGSQHAIKEGKPLYVAKYSEEKSGLPFKLRDLDPSDEREPESLIFLPLLFRGVPLGVLSVQSLRPEAYDREDQQILELLAAHVASALSGIRLFRNLDNLSRTARILAESETVHVTQSIVDQTLTSAKADIVVLYPFDPKSGIFNLPPVTAGEFRRKDFPQPRHCDRDHLPYLAMNLLKPLFAKEAASLWQELGGESSRSQGKFHEREGIVSVAVLPLRVGNERIGCLFLNYRGPQPFDGVQRRLLDCFAVYAAVAIRTARRHEHQSERRLKELKVFQAIDREINRATDHSAVLKTVLERANEIVQAEQASILLFHPEREELWIEEALGSQAQRSLGWTTSVKSEKSLAVWAYQNNQSVLVADVRKEPPWRDLFVGLRKDSRSELDVPLREGGKSIGVINFESSKKGAFSELDQEFVETLVGQIVLAVKKAQDYRIAAADARERGILLELSRRLASEVEFKGLARLILEKAINATEASAGVFLTFDPRRNDLEVQVEFGVEKDSRGRRFRLGEGIVGLAAASRKPLNIDPTDPRYKDDYLEFAKGTRSELAVPVFEEDKTNRLWGVLNVESPEQGKFGLEEERLARALAGLAVVGLQNADRYRRAEEGRLRLKKLQDVSKRLGAINDWGQIRDACQIVNQAASEQCRCTSAVWIQLRTRKDFLMLHRIGELKGPHADAFHQTPESLNRRVLATKKTLHIQDVSTESPPIAKSELPAPDARSVLMVPIQSRDDYYGNLALSHESANAFDKEDVLLAEGFAQVLSITLHRLEVGEEQRRLEERARQSELMSWIGEAAFDLAHRLGNDLGLITSYVNEVRNRLPDEQRDQLVHENLDAIVADVSRVLDLSTRLKLEIADRGEERVGELSAVSVKEIIEDVLEAYRNLPSEAVLRTEAAEDLPPVLAILDYAVDILHNLVENAREAVRDEGTITIRARPDKRFVLIEVTDSGPGVDPKIRERIFGFLFSTKGSSGYGLWSSRRKARALGGDLKEESQPGQGATFTLFLPRADKAMGV